MRFYSAKVICLDLGISRGTLDEKIKKGLYPKYDKSPHRENGVGYFDEKYQMVKSMPKRPRIYDYIKLLEENRELRKTINEIITA